MTIDWNEYEVYDPGVFGPLHELPRREARAAYQRLMDAGPERIEMLRRLTATNGVDLGTDDESIQRLNDWFRANVGEDAQQPGRLQPEWYSVVNDIALFFGAVLMERHPQLHWEFFTWGKRHVSYQRHTIMGFTRPSFPKEDLDIDMLLAQYAHRIIAGQEDKHDAFLRWLAGAAEIA